MKRKILAVATVLTMFGYVISSEVKSAKASDNSFDSSETSSNNNDDATINFISSLFSLVVVCGSMFGLAQYLGTQQREKLEKIRIAFIVKDLALNDSDPEYEKNGLKFEYISNGSNEEVTVYLKNKKVYKALIISSESSVHWEGLPVKETISRVETEHIESPQEWLPLLIKQEKSEQFPLSSSSSQVRSESEKKASLVNNRREIGNIPSVIPDSSSLNSNNLSPSAKNLEQKILFSSEKMEHINSDGYKLYRRGEETQNSELFYKAGEAYDRSYDAFWGDHVFGKTDYRSFLDNLGLSEGIVDEEGVKELIKAQQESLAVSCECYAKCLALEPNHYKANLRLATALTVALQVDVSLPYWRKALAINRSDTLQALIADSTGFNHRSIAAKEVIKHLKLQQSDHPEWAGSLAAFGEVINQFEASDKTQKNSSFLQQKAIASDFLNHSAYFRLEINI